MIPADADLLTGPIQFHASGSAHVLGEKPGQPDLFISAENTFTAMHGDRVVARLITERWLRAIGNSDAQRKRRAARDESSGSWNGPMRQSSARCNDLAIFTLWSLTIRALSTTSMFPHPFLRVSAGVGDKVVAKLDAWPSRHVNPEGHIVEVLGPAGTPGVDMLSIVRKYRLPSEFPQEVVREAESLPRQIDSR